MATREHFLASVPLYASLCDFFIVIAPPVDGGTSFGMETYLLEGSFLLSAVFCFVCALVPRTKFLQSGGTVSCSIGVLGDHKAGAERSSWLASWEQIFTICSSASPATVHSSR